MQSFGAWKPGVSAVFRNDYSLGLAEKIARLLQRAFVIVAAEM
jgi:hypothetical protein